jgi:hypothetical protein
MIHCFQFCFNFAFNFEWRRYTSGGWAVSMGEAASAAAGGARGVAQALGREQEGAALYALLQACPNCTLLETGLILLRANALPPHWGFQPADVLPMGASPDGILLFPWPDTSRPGAAAGLSAVETQIARAVATGVAAAAAAADHSTNSKKGKGSGKGGSSSKAKSKGKAKTKPTTSATTTAKQPNGGEGYAGTYPWGVVPAGYGAVAVEVKVCSPFRWSTEGLSSFNNMASYKVDQSADLPRAHALPLHAPQLQLECLAAGVPGTLMVSYSPVGAGGGGARMLYVPADPVFQRNALSLLREHVSDTGGACRILLATS